MTISDSLRALANFLEDNSDIDVTDQNINLLKYVLTREKLVEMARVSSWKKVYTHDWFELHKDFGNGISLQVYTDRANVCKRVVVGKRIVPAVEAQPDRIEDDVRWVCEDEPLLVGAGQ